MANKRAFESDCNSDIQVVIVTIDYLLLVRSTMDEIILRTLGCVVR